MSRLSKLKANAASVLSFMFAICPAWQHSPGPHLMHAISRLTASSKHDGQLPMNTCRGDVAAYNVVRECKHIQCGNFWDVYSVDDTCWQGAWDKLQL